VFILTYCIGLKYRDCISDNGYCDARTDDDWLEMKFIEIAPLENGTHSPHSPVQVKVCIQARS